MIGLYQEQISDNVTLVYLETLNIVQIYVNDKIEIAYELPENLTVGEFAEIIEEIKLNHKTKTETYDSNPFDLLIPDDSRNDLQPLHNKKRSERSENFAFHAF
jgi:hypothetical protein